MSPCKGVTSQTFYQGSSPNETCLPKDSVHILEHSGRYDEHYERLSTLDEELHDDIRFPEAIMFTSTDAINTWVSKGHEDFFPAELRLIMLRNLNGSFGCEYYRDRDGKVVACDSWSVFKLKRIWKNPNSFKVYDEWLQLSIFVRQDWITSKQLVLFLDCPRYLIDQLHILLPKIHKSDPYAWHALFVSEMRKIYDQAIWDLRGVVWEVEAYQKDLEAFQPQFILLHDLARHISHSKEILDVALETVDSIMHQYVLLDEHHPSPTSRTQWHSRDIERQLYFATKSLRATKLRCNSLSERLQNEINLAFNIVAQRDNEVSIQMAKHSLMDNTMMKTVAIVSLVYLPGTFVSGIFGMNFFDFDGSNGKRRMSISKDFWVYWLITIGLTLTTISIWLLWFNGNLIKAMFVRRSRRSEKCQ